MKQGVPRSSPWGKVDHYKTLCDGAYSVSTASHGGVMVATDRAGKLLSAKAMEHCFTERGYVCFEEDCAATVALRELMDRGLYKAPVNEYWKPGEYEKVINDSIRQWYPDYWAAREAGETREPAGEADIKKRRPLPVLPERCFAVDPETGKMAIVTRGVSGVSLTGTMPIGTTIREGVDKLNEVLGVTPAQAAAMLTGALHGWGKPKADPKNYDRLGRAIKPKSKNDFER